MYPNELRHKFIELRAEGLSLQRIADQLGINKSTALEWHRRFKHDIAELRAFHLEAIRERIAIKYEDELQYAMGVVKHARTLLRTRGLDSMSTTSLYYAEEMAYRRVRRLCALAEQPEFFHAPLPGAYQDPAPDGPADLPPPENPTKTQPFPHQNPGAVAQPAEAAVSQDSGLPPHTCKAPQISVDSPPVQHATRNDSSHPGG